MTWQEGNKPGVVKKHLKPLQINSNVQSGSIFPIRISRVHATDTTASNMVAIW